MGPLEQESLASLIALGFRFSMDHVTDLRIGPRDLSDLGVRFVKIPAPLLLSKTGAAADIHAADLSDLLGRHGVSLIAERIETEASVVDLLDYDVRFGQGFLFSPPRPVRAEALQGSAADRPSRVGSPRPVGFCCPCRDLRRDEARKPRYIAAPLPHRPGFSLDHFHRPFFGARARL